MLHWTQTKYLIWAYKVKAQYVVQFRKQTFGNAHLKKKKKRHKSLNWFA